MTYDTINVRLRPIKLGFLVDPRDKAGLLEAIEINTFLWGGVYNPIIPTFQRLPRLWIERPFRNPTSRTIFAGYLDAYDPDFVVTVGKCSDRTFEVGNRRVIPSSEILAGLEEDGTPRFGVGLFEILEYFIKNELKFIRKKPLDICLPEFGKPFRHFMASVFGFLSQSINRIFRHNFADILEAKNLSCSISDYSEFLAPQKLFLRRLASLYLTAIRSRAFLREACIFFLDAANPMDIIDYWNLRAVGWNVLPVAKQSSKSETTMQLAANFIEGNFYSDHFNPQIYYRTTLVKSRSISKKEVREFGNSLNISASKSGESKMVYQDWYPRIWDEWARDKDDVICCELEARTTKYDLSSYQDRINFKTLDPKFVSRFGINREASFANEIELRSYGAKELLAEVIPEGDENLVRAIGAIGFENWRFSRKGMVYLSSHPDWSVHLSQPKAEDVFSAWLQAKGWEIELSSPGLIANQMVKQLGGIWGISALASETNISLLEKMENNKTLNKEEFWREISRIAGQGVIKDPSKTLKRLTDVQMFRLGVEIQCPICRQHSWYSIKDADYELQCHNCLARFQIPSHSPEDIKWSYRTFGPFSLPRKAYGVYCVLLTLRFFSQLLHRPATPIMSFTATKGGREIEADLGLFFQESYFGSTKTELIFAECKSYNSFTKKDAERMLVLAGQFPGAVLVFSTLKKSLTKMEKRLLRPVVNRGRRYWKAERPFNPVLILTGTELFSNWSPPQSWKDAGGVHEVFAGKHRGLLDLLQLCDATQQLYLDMKPWHQWLEERWERQRQKRELSSKSEIVSRKPT